MTRAEGDVIEHAAILTQRDFAIGAAVQVIKNRPRKPLLGQGPEIVNTDDMGRCDFTCRSGHLLFRTAAAPKHAIIQKNHVGTDDGHLSLRGQWLVIGGSAIRGSSSLVRSRSLGETCPRPLSGARENSC